MGKILDDSETRFFDSVNQDLVELTGVEINYYPYDATDPNNRLNVDPLYGESTKIHVSEPFRIIAVVKYPEFNPMFEESGFSREWDSQVTISRATLDQKHVPYPSEGDMVEMWRTPYHDRLSMGRGMYFDVLKAKHDGHINDTATFTQFVLTLKRRSQYGAERRIVAP